MTTLATHPLEDPDQIALFADNWTALGKPFADKFRAACEAEAELCAGWINPNRVRARLLGEPDYEPRRYSAQWGPACGRDGFMVKTDRPVQISGKGSRGNGNKSTFYRRWIGGAA